MLLFFGCGGRANIENCVGIRFSYHCVIDDCKVRLGRSLVMMLFGWRVAPLPSGLVESLLVESLLVVG